MAIAGIVRGSYLYLIAGQEKSNGLCLWKGGRGRATITGGR